jgi:hypothetical protein
MFGQTPYSLSRPPASLSPVRFHVRCNGTTGNKRPRFLDGKHQPALGQQQPLLSTAINATPRSVRPTKPLRGLKSPIVILKECRFGGCASSSRQSCSSTSTSVDGSATTQSSAYFLGHREFLTNIDTTKARRGDTGVAVIGKKQTKKTEGEKKKIDCQQRFGRNMHREKKNQQINLNRLRGNLSVLCRQLWMWL